MASSNEIKRKLKLTETATARIQQCIADTEVKTTGEIAAVITPESDSYSFFELLFALITGAIVFALLVVFSTPIINWLETFFWVLPEWVYTLFCGAVTFLTIIIVFVCSNITAIDRKIIPISIQHSSVRKRALRCFMESGIYKTKEQSGILIFISYLEREVRILADSGINAKIEQKEWDRIALELATGISSCKSTNNSTDAICKAITECGKLLAENFPAKELNPNEIPDRFVILEAGE